MNRLLRIVLALSAATTLSASEPSAPPADGYAAAVNGRIITVSDVLANIQDVSRELQGKYSGLELERELRKAYDESLTGLIEHALILEDFKAQKGQMPDRAIDGRINELIRERFANDRMAFLKALSTERLTLAEYRENVRDRLIVSALRQQEVLSKIKVSPSDVLALYNSRLDRYSVPPQVKLRMISLTRGEHEKDDAVLRKKLQRARKQLVNGASFDEMAREMSQGVNAAKGGDWGWVDPSELRSELAEAIGALEAGQISDIVETPAELYVLLVEEKKAGSTVPFEDVEQALSSELREKEGERLYNDWVQRLRNKYFVKLY